MTLPALTLIPTAPDGISLVMTGLALFMTLCSALYARGYVEFPRGTGSVLFWCGLWAFGLFACLTVLADNWFSLTVFLELSSVTLFLMILKGDTETALMYILTQFAGAGFLLIGVAMLLHETGSLALGPVPSSALPFFLLGLGIKAALPGLHFWLPRTHSRAPAPASALLSGFAVKMGVYGLIRLSTPAISPLFLTLGLFMALYGIAQALLQHDAKRLLAFSTLSQLGFVLAALGSGTEAGIGAALFYSVAHGLFKGLLFCSAGVLEKSYGTRDLRHLGRAAQDSPATFALFLVGALAVTGFPGTSGFIAKGLVKEALKEGHHPMALWTLLLAGIGTTLYFCRMGYYGFLHRRTSPLKKRRAEPVDSRCLTAMSLMAAATLLLGFIPLFLPGAGPALSAPWLTPENLFTALLPILSGLILFSLAPAFFRPRDTEVPDMYDLLEKTWPVMHKMQSILKKAHTGKLRNYLTVLLAASLIIFALLL